MAYQNEHLLPGIIGSYSLIFATLFAIVAGISFIIYNRSSQDIENKHLFSFARSLYISHFILLLLATAALYYIILNHYFEYSYVWRHSSKGTPIEYIISCFWAGQEGSFLLWILIQSIVGLFFLNRYRNYTPIVLATFSFVQFILLLNIIGIKVGDFQLGASPFFLLRDVMEDPLFKNPDYLKFITDGNGLNPLLLNPWMVSHPPLIFIGYALALPPAALIIAGLVNKSYAVILKPVIKWLLSAIIFLGLGIIVGGAWAYESLTFGGFWAWDPVENASLVPWMIMIAALHLLIMVKRGKNYHIPSYILTIASFWFVIYASFLTRSGVMSDTSVHSFSKESHYTFQLLALLFITIAVPAFLLIKRFKDLHKKEDNSLFSREFLVYAGSIFLVLSAFQIIFSTSIPVINIIFGTNLAPPLQVEAFYNTWQLPFAVIFCILIAFTQYLYYGNNNVAFTLKKMLLPLFLSTILTIILVWFLKLFNISYIALLWSACLCSIFSLDALLRFFKTTSNKTAVITHLGFGIFITGVLITFANKEVLTKSRQSESIMLVKDKAVVKDDFTITYKRNVQVNNRLYFLINMQKKLNNNAKEHFTLTPHIILNENMGNVYEPAIKKYWHQDLFMYITYVDLEAIQSGEDFILQETLNIKLHDTIHFSNTYLYLDSIGLQGSTKEDIINDLRLTARVMVHNPFGKDYLFKPTYKILNNRVFYEDAVNEELGIKIRFSDVLDEEKTIQIQIFEAYTDFVLVKLVRFPYINLMWFGVFILFSGLLMSLIKYFKPHRAKS